jgi:hypothetical protein
MSFIKSDQIGDLATALSKAQAEISGAKADSTNPFFKSSYADLASVWEAIRVPFSKNGLSVSQIEDFVDGKSLLITVLLHSSGQFLTGTREIKFVKDDPQGYLAGLTYARRGSLSALAGVAQVDDDGNEASGKKPVGSCVGGSFQKTKEAFETEARPGPEEGQNDFPGLDIDSLPKAPPKASIHLPAEPKPTSGGGPTEKQIKRLFAIAYNNGWSDFEIKQFLEQRYKIKSVNGLTIPNYEFMCTFVAQTKPEKK